jgi:hypothetical protein
VLFVEGEKFNVSRFYAPPAPNLAPGLGDFISYDQSGMPIINRPITPIPYSDSHKVKGSATLVQQTNVQVYAQYSPYQLMLEAQRGAMMAEAQLEGDLALIRSTNQVRKQFNDLVMTVARAATGKDLGRTPRDWREAISTGSNSSRQPSRTQWKPTFSEEVPLVYIPTFAHVGLTSLSQINYYVDN